MHAIGHTSEVGVLIPAAGSGTRLGGQRKQFRVLGGKPLLVQTMLAFERHPLVRHIVVAAPADCGEEFQEELARAGLTKLCAVVCGGETRQDSVRQALAALPPEADVVLVHDAVRPFIRPSYISAVIEAAGTYGAAALAVPVADTLRRGEGGAFGETVSREGLFRMQTPQGFRRSLIEAAHRTAADAPHRATDDVALVIRSGHVVRMVRGGPENMKITTPQDWDLAEVLWPVWEAQASREQYTPEPARRQTT